MVDFSSRTQAAFDHQKRPVAQKDRFANLSPNIQAPTVPDTYYVVDFSGMYNLVYKKDNIDIIRSSHVEIWTHMNRRVACASTTARACARTAEFCSCLRSGMYVSTTKRLLDIDKKIPHGGGLNLPLESKPSTGS